MAMADRANITYKQMRKMRPFLIADRVNPLHSEHEVRKLELHSVHQPEFVQFKEEQYKRQGWVLPLDDIIKDFLHNALEHSMLHVILSADHGQGHWKANIACVLIQNNRVVRESNTVIASIECRKDKREVLIDSGVPAKINQLLQAIKGHGGDGAIKLFATGDLAWYAEALGKPNMAGDHCALCQWRCLKGSRKANPRKQYQVWNTMDQLKECFNKLEAGELDRTDKSQECGVVATPLIDAIEPPDYITPLLHCVTLFMNTPFKYLHRWIWYRVEGVSMELIHARDELTLLAIDKDSRWDEKLESEEYLQLMYAELEAVSPEVHLVFDDKEHQAEYEQQKAIVAVAEEAVDEAELAYQTAAGAVRKAAAKVNKLESRKAHGRAHQSVWAMVENKLKEFKVYCSAYHGGDLEGNQCRQLMKDSPAIMAAIKDLLLEYLAELPAEEKARGRLADAAEVEQFCRGFERLFQYFDVVSHHCYQPFGSLTDSDIGKLQVAVDRLVDLYLRIMPNCPMKLHMIATHLVPHVKQFRGLKSHHESHIERAHQQGVRDRRRLGVLGSYERKTVSALKTETTANKPEVLAMVADTEAQRKRKRKAAVLEEAGAGVVVEARLAYLGSVLDLPAIVTEFPSLLELAKESMKKD